MLYMASGRQVYCKLTKSVITIIFDTTANMQSQLQLNTTYNDKTTIILTKLQHKVSVLKISFLVTGHAGIGYEIPMKVHRLTYDAITTMDNI